LSPFRPSDLPDILAYAGNEEVARTVLWPAHKTLEDSQAYLDWIERNLFFEPGKLFFVWALRKVEDGKAIGSIDFKQPYPHVGQIDYAIAQSEWRKGYVTEAALTVKKWAFENLPELQRFQSFCIASNIASRRVMEKCGMEFEGLRKKAIALKGIPVDLACYALVK